MEKEKFENQKIDENKMENVAGGYTPVKSRLSDGSISLHSIKMNTKEYHNLRDASCVDYMQDESTGEYQGYIKKENLNKAINVLNKGESFILPPSESMDKEYELKIIF